MTDQPNPDLPSQLELFKENTILLLWLNVLLNCWGEDVDTTIEYFHRSLYQLAEASGPEANCAPEDWDRILRPLLPDLSDFAQQIEEKLRMPVALRPGKNVNSRLDNMPLPPAGSVISGILQ